MYSRFPRPSERPVRLPEHYSGCAFAAPQPAPEAPPQPRVPDRPAPPGPEARTDAGPACPAPPPLSLSLLAGKDGKPRPGGLGFDELLLLGLILLLAHTGQSSDVILWLALLLFCP